MNNDKRLLAVLIALLVVGTMPLSAVEGDLHTSDFVNALLNNQYLLENIRLVALAEQSFAEGNYDDAINYAVEAIRFAELSDEFVSLQALIKEANDAILAADARLAWARQTGVSTRHATEYQEAASVFAEALEARSREEWANARDLALRVLAIFEGIPGVTTLPAQYLVRSWHTTRDCLWNIAAMEEIYGDPWQWRHIYNANRDKMPQPGNPDLIHPGMILDIPSIRGEFRHGIMEGR